LTTITEAAFTFITNFGIIAFASAAVPATASADAAAIQIILATIFIFPLLNLVDSKSSRLCAWRIAYAFFGIEQEE
jgi:hypothetical protein